MGHLNRDVRPAQLVPDRFCCQMAKCVVPRIPCPDLEAPYAVGVGRLDLVLEGFFLYLRVCLSAQVRWMRTNQMAGDDVDLPGSRKMVDEDQEEEDKDSILGHLQNLQNMDLGLHQEKARATFSEIKQAVADRSAL